MPDIKILVKIDQESYERFKEVVLALLGDKRGTIPHEYFNKALDCFLRSTEQSINSSAGKYGIAESLPLPSKISLLRSELKKVGMEL